jgi:6,7-dimethyl-8-ribityllumazine synthase
MENASFREIEGGVSAAGISMAIIVSRFNHSITQRLLDGAIHCLKKNGADLEHDIDIFYCPGAFELPQVASYITGKKKYQAVMCLGAVIRGETPHFDYICQECARGIGQVWRAHDEHVRAGDGTIRRFGWK